MPDRSTRSRLPFQTLLALACLLFLVASGGLARAQQGLIQRSDAPDLFLLYTGDVIGYVGPCG